MSLTIEQKSLILEQMRNTNSSYTTGLSGRNPMVEPVNTQSFTEDVFLQEPTGFRPFLLRFTLCFFLFAGCLVCSKSHIKLQDHTVEDLLPFITENQVPTQIDSSVESFCQSIIDHIKENK